jgi:hypothetical protein
MYVSSALRQNEFNDIELTTKRKRPSKSTREKSTKNKKRPQSIRLVTTSIENKKPMKIRPTTSFRREEPTNLESYYTTGKRSININTP